MVNVARPAVVSPQIYGPDDLEKIFAQQMFTNPDLGGSAYAMLTAASRHRAEDVQDYLSNVAASNQLQAKLIQQGYEADLMKTGLEQIPHLATAGIPIENVPLAARNISGGGTDHLAQDGAFRNNKLKQAEIQQKLAAAAASAQD